MVNFKKYPRITMPVARKMETKKLGTNNQKMDFVESMFQVQNETNT